MLFWAHILVLASHYFVTKAFHHYLVALHSDSVPSDSLHLDIAKSVVGFVRSGDGYACFDINCTISRTWHTGTFSAEWGGGATRRLGVAVALLIKHRRTSLSSSTSTRCLCWKSQPRLSSGHSLSYPDNWKNIFTWPFSYLVFWIFGWRSRFFL